MKNKIFRKYFIGSLLPISLAVGVLFGANKQEVTKTNAYSRSSLPTTLFVGDNTEQEIRSYYSSLNNKTNSERSGTNLLKNLKGILMNGQKYYSYDTGQDDIWKIYEIVDRDWAKSPASEISGYNSETKTITGYSYKSTDPYVHALYVDRSVTNQMTAHSNHQQTLWGINKEHIWAKSQGFEENGAGGARGDIMHLWAADGKTNNLHSNYSFGYVDKSKTYSTPNGISYAQNNLLGKSKTLGGSTNVFEPQDSDKGDIARALFYMAARYNDYDGDTNIDSNNPNLRLVDSLCNLTSYTSTSSNPGQMGIVSDLLEWNKLDPVDEFERHRNDLCYNNYTNNRNPFIDFPDWADIIWGNKSGVATPATDPINGGEQGEEPILTSIEVTTKPTKRVYVEGDSFDPTGMIVEGHFNDNSSKNIVGKCTFSPSGALTLSDTTITVSCDGKTDSFDIAVLENDGSEAESKSLTLSNLGASLDTTSNTEIATTSIMATGDSVASYDLNYLQGKKQDSAILLANDVGSFISNKTPIPGKISSVTVYINGTASDKTTYYCAFGTTEFTSAYSTGLTAVNIKKGESYTFNCNSEGCKYFCVSLGNSNNGQVLSLDINYEVPAAPTIVKATSVSLSPSSLSIHVGGSSTITPTIAPSNASVSLLDWSSDDTNVARVSKDGVVTGVSTGNATITCSTVDGSNKFSTCSVTVTAAPTLSSLSVSGGPRSFYEGDDFSYEGMVVTATYSDSSTEDVTDDAEFSGYDMSEVGNQTVTVSFNGVSTTYSISVLEALTKTYRRASGALTEGDYLFSYTANNVTRLMNGIVDSSRLGFEVGTINSDDSIDTNNINDVWHVAKSGDYYTIKNKKSNLYAASTGVSNKVQMIGEINDYSLWSLSINSTNNAYFFTNKYNEAHSVNSVLQNNGSYGFSCYAASNNKPLSLYRLENTEFIKCTNLTDLDDGDEITILANKNTDTTNKYGINGHNGNYFTVEAQNYKNDGEYTCFSSQMYTFKLHKSGSTFALESAGGYMSKPKSTSDKEYLSSTLDGDNTSFEITLVGSSFRIRSIAVSTYYLRCSYNNDECNMLVFSSTITSYTLDIYEARKTADADLWSKSFLEETQGCDIDSWDSLAEQYNLLCNEAKNTIKSANANQYGSWCEQAMARYDYMLTDFNADDNLDNFVSDRQVSNSRTSMFLTLVKNNPQSIIIVIFTICGVFVIGSYIYIKRRKLNE